MKGTELVNDRARRSVKKGFQNFNIRFTFYNTPHEVLSMKHLKAGIRVLVFVMLLWGMAFTYVPHEADAGIRTVVTVSLTPASQEADVSPGSSGVVIFSGTVEVQSGERTVVNLQATAQIGTAVVSPSSAVVPAGGGSFPISVSVREPPETSYTLTDKVTVGGTWQSGALAGPVSETSAQVVIKQFFRMTISTQSPYVEVKPGSQVYFDILIENNGNGRDTFTVEIDPDNLKELTAKDWAVQVGTPKVTIDEKAKKHVTIIATTPQKTTPWKNSIDRIVVVVKSENAQNVGQNVKETYNLYVRQHGFHIPGFEPAFALLALAMVAALMKKKAIRTR